MVFGIRPDPDENAPSEQVFDDVDSIVSESNPPVKEHVIAKRENRAVNIIRAVTAFVVLAAAAAVSYSVYRYANETELENFRTQFEHQGGKVADEFVANAKRRVTVLRQFAQSISLQAEMANESFPFFTARNLEEQSYFILELAQVVGMAIHPIVHEEQVTKWSDYVAAEQGWLARELAWQQTMDAVKDKDGEAVTLAEAGSWLDNSSTDDLGSFPTDIYSVSSGGTLKIAEGPGPFAPKWQLIPALPLPPMFNFDALSDPELRQLWKFSIENETTVISGALDFSDDSNFIVEGRKAIIDLMLNRWKGGGNDFEGGPFAAILVPIPNRLAENSTRRVGAILMGFVYWHVYFVGILPEGAVGVVVVLKNTCDQAFTFQIDGNVVTYLGLGDLHDSTFDDLVINTKWSDLLDAVATETDAACNYRISVYPSEMFKDEFITFGPMIFAIVVCSVFILTSLIFLTYDWLVQRRHKVVNDTAQKTNAVVSSLFPDQVRARLDNIYSDDRNTNPEGWPRIDSTTGSDPIADLYPNCTVREEKIWFPEPN